MIGALWHAFLHYTGSDNVSGPWYGFWSGFAGDLAIFGGVFAALRHRNCHVRGCWRLGHIDPEHHHPACRRHHSSAGRLG